MSFFTTIISTTLQDVSNWTIAEKKTDYISAVKRCSELYGNRQLSDIPADLAEVKRRFPLDGFDPRYFKTEKAYKAWRRKVIAAIKGCTGQLDEEKARRARQDDWADLIDIVQHLVNRSVAGEYPKQILIPIRKLADFSRQHGKRPNQVSQAWLADVRSELGPNEWKSVQSALDRLDALRVLPPIRDFLPELPFGKSAALRTNVLPGVPAHIAEEIVTWVNVATRGKFDPVEQTYENANSPDDISFKTAALRKFVSSLSESKTLGEGDSLKDLLTPDNATLVIRNWTAKTDGPGRISATTANAYKTAIQTVMARNGVSPAELKQHLENNKFLDKGKSQEKGMSPKVRHFCETLLGSKQRVLTFLSLHVEFRNKAQGLFDEYTRDDREMTRRETEAVRALGTLAAVCAIETRGAPIRIENALGLVIGEGRITFHLPSRMTDHATIDLAPEDTKNGNEIWAPIVRGNLNGLEVIEWYNKTIRPLYPNASSSPFLFPSIETTGSLQYKTFLGWFKRETRAAGLPMTPHNFRHGLASLLIQANPGRWDLLERLLDGTAGTARSYYGWVNKRTQRSDVQKYVLDLSRIAA